MAYLQRLAKDGQRDCRHVGDSGGRPPKAVIHNFRAGQDGYAPLFGGGRPADRGIRPSAGQVLCLVGEQMFTNPRRSLC
jgi:hypothetical protein